MWRGRLYAVGIESFGGHRFGVSVPGIRFVHADSGVLGIEWIDGSSVRKVLGGGAEGEEESDELEIEQEEDEEVDVLKEMYGLTEGESFGSFRAGAGAMNERG